MGSVTLRLFGRFFYAGKMDKDGFAKISAIAPKFDDPFGKHRPFMTIPRHGLNFGKKGELVTRAPDLRIVSDAESMHHAELFLWDLSGLRVTYDAPGSVSFEVEEEHHDGQEGTAGHAGQAGQAGQQHAPRRLLNLDELAEFGGGKPPSLHPDALDPDGRSNAIVEFTAGQGKARPIDHGIVRLARMSDAPDIKDPTDPRLIQDQGGFVQFEAANLVEFKVDSPNDRLTLSFMNEDGEPKGIVTVKSQTRVSISNLLRGLIAPMPADLEFSQYYDLLQKNPGGDALIPFEVPNIGGLGEGPDCDFQVWLRIPPPRPDPPGPIEIGKTQGSST